jgi:hypothetical protein
MYIQFSSVQRLNEMGARKFVVSDVGPLGCIPYARALQFMPPREMFSVSESGH